MGIVINNCSSRLWSFITGNSFGLKTKKTRTTKGKRRKNTWPNNVGWLQDLRGIKGPRCRWGGYSQSCFASSNMKTSLVVSLNKLAPFHFYGTFKFELNSSLTCGNRLKFRFWFWAPLWPLLLRMANMRHRPTRRSTTATSSTPTCPANTSTNSDTTAEMLITIATSTSSPRITVSAPRSANQFNSDF